MADILFTHSIPPNSAVNNEVFTPLKTSMTILETLCTVGRKGRCTPVPPLRGAGPRPRPSSKVGISFDLSGRCDIFVLGTENAQKDNNLGYISAAGLYRLR